MTTTIYDVCGIGNAIVDILAQTEDSFIIEQELAKGAMTLISETRAEYLYSLMKNAKECSGGSVANSMAGIASLGGMPSYIGKLKQDALGESFRYDMRTIGVHFDTPMAAGGKSTARCFVFVTPDAQRTMNTYIGACADIGADDINDALIAHSQVTYVEGYLWDQPSAKEAIRKAFTVAHAYKRKVAFTLSDVFCVERHRAEFLELLGGAIDIVFANEEELYALLQTRDFDKACEALGKKCEVAIVTRSEKGSVIINQGSVITIEPKQDLTVIDTTGAGDLYAAGFLFGYTKGWGLRECGLLATKCASAIIQQIGARPESSLKTLL